MQPIPANAITIGISPVNINNNILVPGAKLSSDFTFSLAELEQDMLVEIEVESDEIADWITFSTGNSFEYKQGQANQKVTVIIDVPQDAKFKKYEAIIRFNAKEVSASKDVARVVSGTRLDVNIEVSNRRQAGLTVSLVTIKLSEDKNKILLTAKTSNTGNFENGLDKVIVLVTDLNDRTIAKLEQDIDRLIPPFSSQDTIIEFDNTFKKGEYYANVGLFSGSSSIYDNKLLLNIDGESVVALTEVGNVITTDDYIILAVGTLLGFISLLIIIKFAKKKLTTSTVIITFITIIPILALLSFYGYYGKVLYDRQLQQNNSEQNIDKTNSKAFETYILLDEKTIKFKQDSELYEAAIINPKVKLVAVAGSSYTIISEVNGWYKLEIAPDEFGFIKKE